MERGTRISLSTLYPMRIIQYLTFGLPWVIYPFVEEPLWEPKAVVWLLGCSGLVALTLFTPRLLKAWKTPWAGWLLGWALLGSVLHFWFPYMTRFPSETRVVFNIYQWLPIPFLLVGFLSVRLLQGAYLTSWLAISHLTKWWCWSAFLLACYMLLQAAGLDPFFAPRHPLEMKINTYGAFGNPQAAASLLAVTTPLYFIFRERRYLLMLLIVLIAISLAGFKGAWVASGAALLTYGYLRLRQQPWFLTARPLAHSLGVGGIILASSFLWPHLRSDERWPLWKETVYQWQAEQMTLRWVRPDPDIPEDMRISTWTIQTALTGKGLESFRDRFQRRYPTLRESFKALMPTQQGAYQPRPHHPHNELLLVLYELGLIGVLLAIGLLYSAFRTGWQGVVTFAGASWWASGVGFLLMSAIYFPLHLAAHAWQGMTIWAVLEAQPVEGT